VQRGGTTPPSDKQTAPQSQTAQTPVSYQGIAKSLTLASSLLCLHNINNNLKNNKSVGRSSQLHNARFMRDHESEIRGRVGHSPLGSDRRAGTRGYVRRASSQSHTAKKFEPREAPVFFDQFHSFGESLAPKCPDPARSHIDLMPFFNHGDCCPRSCLERLWPHSTEVCRYVNF
jgi:hypothetical protein